MLPVPRSKACRRKRGMEEEEEEGHVAASELRRRDCSVLLLGLSLVLLGQFPDCMLPRLVTQHVEMVPPARPECWMVLIPSRHTSLASLGEDRLQ